MRGFNRIARWYRLLERLAFGSDLERSRFMFLGELRDCRDILLLGEGDGRCCERLVALAPAARITCVDSSPGMIAVARSRVGSAGAGERVSFVQADLRAYEPARDAFDAVVTFYVLDCFGDDDARRVVERASLALRAGGQWLYADFALPESGLVRLRARAWLAFLYAFFRLETGLEASRLPDAERMIESRGLALVDGQELQCGLIRSCRFRRDTVTGARSAAAGSAPQAR
jgi:ubiquinone/menaquinone biosynthesis C-methylase UbiE